MGCLLSAPTDKQIKLLLKLTRGSSHFEASPKIEKKIETLKNLQKNPFMVNI